MLICLLGCVETTEVKLISDFCDLQPEFPMVSDPVIDYSIEIKKTIIHKEQKNLRLTTEEAFAKATLEFIGESKKTREENCKNLQTN